MNYCMKVNGLQWRYNQNIKEAVVGYVQFSDYKMHKAIVEDSFKYHLGLDLDYMYKHHRSHFSEPHNVSRAILLYHYFRNKGLFFTDNHWESITPIDLPKKEPDSEGDDYKIWICNSNI